MGSAAYKKLINFSDVAGGAGAYVKIPATSASLSENGTVLDDTIFHEEGHRSRILGLLDWSVSVTANYIGANLAIPAVFLAQQNRDELWVNYLPTGQIAGGVKGKCIVESFTLSGGVDELETLEISLQANGALAPATANP